MKYAWTIFALALLCPACSKQSGSGGAGGAAAPSTLTMDFDEAEMDAAIAKARSRVEEFITALAAHDADSYSVKAPIEDEGQVEHFWVVDVSYKDGVFSGEIGNDPGIVKNVKSGQKWTISKDKISDWMFVKGDMIHGGFTIEPLLKSMPQDRADAMRAKLVR